jgi:hypothetical protein
VDEYYRVPLTGGVWPGLGEPAGHPFRAPSGGLGYRSDDGVYLTGDDFLAGTRISHEPSAEESQFTSPYAYPGGLSYQTRVDNEPPADAVYLGEGDEYRLYVVLDGDESRIPVGLPVSTSGYYSMRLLGKGRGTAVYATQSYNPGNLYYVDAALQATLLAREIKAIY